MQSRSEVAACSRHSLHTRRLEAPPAAAPPGQTHPLRAPQPALLFDPPPLPPLPPLPPPPHAKRGQHVLQLKWLPQTEDLFNKPFADFYLLNYN